MHKIVGDGIVNLIELGWIRPLKLTSNQVSSLFPSLLQPSSVVSTASLLNELQLARGRALTPAAAVRTG